jgi:hypothetical protein
MTSITVNVHSLNRPTQPITVCALDPVHVLHDQIPRTGRRMVVHRGSLVMAAFSFQHHGIKDGDDLYIVETKARTHRGCAQEIWNSPTRKLFTRESRAQYSCLNDRSLLRELARLCDLSDHWRPPARRSVDAEPLNEQPPAQRPVPARIAPKTEAPNTEALPTWW